MINGSFIKSSKIIKNNNNKYEIKCKTKNKTNNLFLVCLGDVQYIVDEYCIVKNRTNLCWLIKDKLVPNVHYVLLKDDFSDLEEKFKWCKNNPNKCKEIISNASNYMKQFKNKKQEEQLEKRILNTYFKTINFK